MDGLWDTLLSALSGAGKVLDYPGRLVRSGLAGRFGEDVSGRDLLEQYGVLDKNQEGLDAGDVAGFGAEMLLDPLNMIGGGLLGKATKGLSRAKKAQKALDNPVMDVATHAASHVGATPSPSPLSMLGEAGSTVAEAAASAKPGQWDFLLDMLRKAEPGADRGALVTAGQLRKQIPNMSKETFDEMMRQAGKSGDISLHAHDFPTSLTPKELKELIHDPTFDIWDYGGKDGPGKGTYYVGAAIRQDRPKPMAFNPTNETVGRTRKGVTHGPQTVAPPGQEIVSETARQMGKLTKPKDNRKKLLAAIAAYNAQRGASDVSASE